jgi:hypothetical protein
MRSSRLPRQPLCLEPFPVFLNRQLFGLILAGDGGGTSRRFKQPLCRFTLLIVHILSLVKHLNGHGRVKPLPRPVINPSYIQTGSRPTTCGKTGRCVFQFLGR